MSAGTLRARKKLQTFRALAEAARRLTLERGLEEVTVEEIAEAAGVSTRTFFNYFSSKEEAIIGIEPEVLAEMASELEQRPAGEGPLEALFALLVTDHDDPTDVAERWVLRTQLVRQYPALLPRHMAGLYQMEQHLVRALAARLGTDPDRDPYPAVVVSAVVAALRTTIHWWHEHGPDRSFPELLRESFDVLAAGLDRPRSEKGPRP